MQSIRIGRFVRTTGLSLVASLAVAASAACSTVRARESAKADVESPARAPLEPRAAVAPAPLRAPPGGPMDAGSLARETGLTVEDQGNSVLLCGATRARFFPNSDRMSIDGSFTSMGEPARRGEVGFVIPATGVDAVKRAVAVARNRPEHTTYILAGPTIPKGPPPGIYVPTPKPAAARGSVGGDAAWASLAANERDWNWIVVHHSDDDSGCL